MHRWHRLTQLGLAEDFRGLRLVVTQRDQTRATLGEEALVVASALGRPEVHIRLLQPAAVASRIAERWRSECLDI